jgi:phenylacetate-coenzyme A ligase PaaK-like adenylate-forming protein
MKYETIFSIASPSQFEEVALSVFLHQYHHCPPYRKFCELLKIDPLAVREVDKIPFLPIEFFKSKKIISEEKKTALTFVSSGTTGSVPSKHYVADVQLYEESFNRCFHLFYGDASNYTFLALLPSYLERGDSSLVYMAQRLIEQSQDKRSGFYLYDLERLATTLQELEKERKKTILLGVTYALLDLMENYSLQLKYTAIMETGGMKGRRRELIREELHTKLQLGFGVSSVHSEYGMTELLSQAYSQGQGVYKCPPWMKILTRDTEDALRYVHGVTGGINVIDLANLHSCSFIATQDLGKVYPNGTFEVLGRFDSSDIRGCNLMVL